MHWNGHCGVGGCKVTPSERLGLLKLRLNLTTAGLAELLGLPASTVQHWLRGHQQPRNWPEDAVAGLEQASVDSAEVRSARAAHPDRRGRRR